MVARRLHDAGHDVVMFEHGPSLPATSVPAQIDGDDSFAALALTDRVHRDVTASRMSGATRHPYWRGRGVGGSSAVNTMVGLYGDLEQYRSWGWDDIDDLIARLLVPMTPPAPGELGRMDHLLAEADRRTTPVALTRRAGRRVTSAEAYLWPIAEDDRFTLHCEHVVNRVMFDGSGTAVGVITRSGESFPADRVVLAAGAIHSPTILLRSGVERAGTGLQDHPAVGFAVEFPVARRSPLGLVTGSVVDLDPIQLLPLNHLGTDQAPSLGMLLVALMRPVGASGRVQLASDDPAVAPIVDFDLLSDQRDIALLRHGVRSALEVLDSEVFAHVDISIDHVGTRASSLDNDASIDRWIRTAGADYVHATSSCAAVLGDHGAVRGVDGLFVADASAFPSIPSVNTHVPTMLLAERFAARWRAAS